MPNRTRMKKAEENIERRNLLGIDQCDDVKWNRTIYSIEIVIPVTFKRFNCNTEMARCTDSLTSATAKYC